MPSFLNFSRRHQFKQENNNYGYNKTPNYYITPNYVKNHFNGVANNNYYSVPFRPRPIKHHRKRLIHNNNSRTVPFKFDIPGSIHKYNANDDNCKNIISWNFSWNNRL